MRVVVAGAVLHAACSDGERRPTPVEPTPEVSPGAAQAPDAPAHPAADVFVAPGADGWGTVAGLRYVEQVRGVAEPDAPLPMIVVLHGRGDRPHPEWIGDLPVPVRVVAPQGPMEYYGEFAWFEYRVADHRPDRLAREIQGATERLVRAIDQLRMQRPTRGVPLVTGFSQGGMLSFALALHHPGTVAFAAPISGLLPEPLWPSAKAAGTNYPPIRALHGDADTLVPIDAARSLVGHLARLGFDASLDEYPGVMHAITPAMFADVHHMLGRALAELPAR
jgi:phospholipase/carboxylesterase